VIARALLPVLAALAVAALLASPASAAPEVNGEFAIPSGVGSNNDIVEGPDGNMWVTTENNNKVARITPAGVVTEFQLNNTAFGVASGPDGNIWVSTTVGVVKVPPANPAGATTFNNIGLTNGSGIVAGPDGNMWVAGDGELIRFDPTDPEGTEDENPILGLQPKGMTVGTDGLLWIASNDGRVVSATATDTPTTVDYDIQIAAAGGAQGVGAGPNGQVAYVAPTTSPQTVGRITPGGTPLKTNLPASDPFGVTFGNDGAYWIARSATNDLLRMTPGGQTTTLGGFSPAIAVGPRKISTGPNNTLWVTLDSQEKVARVTGVAPEPTAPDTKLDGKPKKKLKAKDKRNGKKGKARAKFRFSSATAGATFECSLVKKGKAAKFKRCSSPKKYGLKPGKYEFAVRAVAAGEPDPSPASYRFKVVRKRR
jgi:streptogramin lyase